LADADDCVHLLDPSTQKETRTLNAGLNLKPGEVAIGGKTISVRRATFSPDSGRLATWALSGPVRVFNVKTGEELQPLAERPGGFGGVKFSPAGKRLATAGHGQTGGVRGGAPGPEPSA